MNLAPGFEHTTSVFLGLFVTPWVTSRSMSLAKAGSLKKGSLEALALERAHP